MEPMTNFKNRTVWIRDNIDVLRGINSESIDLIYLDPPFNSKANYAAPIGSKAAGAAFKDTWSLSDVDREWINLLEAKHDKLYRILLAALTDNDKSYLAYMAERLLELRRVLKPTGSIYLHCDPTMSHYLKLVMDAIFGRGNFRNEIVWCYTGPGSPKMRQFNRKHDIIFWYTKSDSQWCFNMDAVRIHHHAKTKDNFKDGLRGSGFIKGGYGLASGKVPESWWPQAKGNGLAIAARQKVQYQGYPTQKPRALLERIIEASSNKGDIVLDPFCGCATTMVAAENLYRRWIGIDFSPIAVRLVRDRLAGPEYGPMFERQWVIDRDDLPIRSDLGKLPAPRTHKKVLYGEQGGYCQGCRGHFPPHGLEVDHIIARARGGTDHIENLQLLCGHCNKTKGQRGMAYLKAKLQIA